jgi:hypothetical protein
MEAVEDVVAAGCTDSAPPPVILAPAAIGAVHNQNISGKKKKKNPRKEHGQRDDPKPILPNPWRASSSNSARRLASRSSRF